MQDHESGVILSHAAPVTNANNSRTSTMILALDYLMELQGTCAGHPHISIFVLSQESATKSPNRHLSTSTYHIYISICIYIYLCACVHRYMPILTIPTGLPSAPISLGSTISRTFRELNPRRANAPAIFVGRKSRHLLDSTSSRAHANRSLGRASLMKAFGLCR